MAVLWAMQYHRPWGKKFVFITDCFTLMWLLKSQALSSKLHRWALRLMEYDRTSSGDRGQTISSRTPYRGCP